MSAIVNSIAGRMSLRTPQRTSLDILERISQTLTLRKGDDVADALVKVRAAFPEVEDFTDFEREFPSFCFALATGVGKTRLMGAFITYLYLARGFRHFFVLAPNLTIYDKLIRDFTPNTPKYVFHGIGEFSTNLPEVITGDTWESGRGVRRGNMLESDEIHVNIFNISKINAEVRGDKAPRIKRLHEVIGQSYFDYLSGLDDLVLIMDESHRYRASAGAKAINDLRPVLGLELTATPQVEVKGDAVPFKNTIFAYPLSAAMTDGFVKEPAVATRENFDPKQYSEEKLEVLKLEDGMRLHEDTKLKLDTYSKQTGRPAVKPFVLVVARDVEHAEALRKRIEDPSFFDGRYAGKVITVHSDQKTVEKDETIAQLMTVEQPANPTEIVIHVNMLKEGWDVTNLYTIVPLRKADSKTLVEQSIGRGLRLPYGKRTGVPEVDRLTIVAHDKFNEIVQYAKDPNSVIHGGMKTVFVPTERLKPVASHRMLDVALFGAPADAPAEVQKAKPLFTAPAHREIAKTALQIAERDFTRVARTEDFLKPDNLEKLVKAVEQAMVPAQGELPGAHPKENVREIVLKTLERKADFDIDIPRLLVAPKGESVWRHVSFDVDVSKISYHPVDEALLIEELKKGERYRLEGSADALMEAKLEDRIVDNLAQKDDICYDSEAGVLYDLVGQVVAHLRGYLKTDKAVRNVVLHHEADIAENVYSQMADHIEERADAYTIELSHGREPLIPPVGLSPETENDRDFRLEPSPKRDIPKMIFTGFNRCSFDRLRFQSDAERRFAVMIDRKDSGVRRWMKASPNQFRIYYKGEHRYDPDFVVELADRKLLCEIKADGDIEDREVQAKAREAAAWCEYATQLCKAAGAKPWSYVLIPESRIQENATLAAIERDCTFKLADDLLKKIRAFGVDLDGASSARPA
ncbi:MAG: DEAD/DEAH box helicase family protein [Planctomycetia bacterium]|nr:DEAD/DEAH box helicase family protein [Planctomycetia bacterium]